MQPPEFYRPLAAAFYRRDTVTVARELLGKGLQRAWRGSWIGGVIVEVEAYLGDADAASHSYRGETPRNSSMFAGGGLCYVYLSYGVNYCMNVVTGEVGQGHAVLIRAIEPVWGLAEMQARRRIAVAETAAQMRKISCGPGMLTQALGVDLRLNGEPLTGARLRIVDLGRRLSGRQIVASTRIGITKAAELPLRFTVKDSAWLSRRV